ncbi:MAG TPA: hypothetical protein VED59_06745 [Acidimicrobiales bacterium]|nr:hypothetical protein [Acidimicrobiales bacterium]
MVEAAPVALLFGKYEHMLDSKWRVTLPADLRSRFVTGPRNAVVSKYFEGCVAVWPPDVHQERLAKALPALDGSKDDRWDARALTGDSSLVDVDTQWRITIPAGYREYARLSLGEPVIIHGMLNHIELWRAEVWEANMAKRRKTVAGSASDIPVPAGGLPREAE